MNKTGERIMVEKKTLIANILPFVGEFLTPSVNWRVVGQSGTTKYCFTASYTTSPYTDFQFSFASSLPICLKSQFRKKNLVGCLHLYRDLHG